MEKGPGTQAVRTSPGSLRAAPCSSLTVPERRPGSAPPLHRYICHRGHRERRRWASSVISGRQHKPGRFCEMKGVHHVVACLACSGVLGGLDRWAAVLRGEGVSRSESEPVSASLHCLGVANPPEMPKPSAGGAEAGARTRPAPRGYEGRRAPKDRSRNLGGPAASGSVLGPQAGMYNRRTARAGVGWARSSGDAE